MKEPVKLQTPYPTKKYSYILDDVATFDQLDALLGPKRLYTGSKVIITTRHKELSTAFTVHPKVFSVETLSTADSLELFSLHAFHQYQPVEPYIVQSKLFVNHCMGLPLALKVLGSSQRENTINEWKDTMRRLEATLDPEIQEVLEISYKNLKHDTDKELFLHVACFFEGEEEDYIVKLLTHCDLYPVVGIKNLMNRCLLYVEDGRVMMHQLIKDMGQEVVRKESKTEPRKRSRLWHRCDCINVLRDQSGTEKVEGLMLDMSHMKEAKSTLSFRKLFGKRMHGNNASFEIGALEKMTNLMLLQLNYAPFSGKCKKLPKKLRLLRWHGFTLKVIPRDICLEKLVVLDMSYSKLKLVWNNFKFIGSLKILNLSHSRGLIKTPDFGGLPGLETLILKGCSSLIKVDKSIACLKELALLDLSDCTSLIEFPCFPTSLVSLQLSGSGILRRGLTLNFVPLPSVLVHMNLSNCNLFDGSFPNDWSSLVSLVYLKIDGNNVTCLPKCIQTLPTCRYLSVINCSNIQSILGLPKSFIDMIAVVLYDNCPKLCEVDGRYKIRPTNKVERKFIRYIGLESNEGEGMELGHKANGCVSHVLHECGIFCTSCVSRTQVPSGFMYKDRSPQITLKIPQHDDNLRISGFNMCVVLSQSTRYNFFRLRIEVYNKTKDMLWRYHRTPKKIPKNVDDYAWLSLRRCGNLLEAGDEIVISIIEYGEVHIGSIVHQDTHHQDVEECCINLIYEDDEELLDGETKEAHHVNALDQISWTDRMDEDILNYVL